MLLIQEYINPLLILSNVIKKSNTITSNTIAEGIINNIPILPKPDTPIDIIPVKKPKDDKIKPIILHIIDTILNILNRSIYFSPFLIGSVKTL